MAALGSALHRPGLPPRWQRRWQAWWDGRHPRADTLELTQRNVYILPTRPGALFAATLLVLLVASINYQLSLGYVLTFLLAGSGIVSMHVTHATLRGLTLHLRAPQPVFSGDAVQLDCVLASTGAAPRHGIGLRVDQPGAPHWSWADVPPGGQATVTLAWTAPRRGRLALPEVVLETRFPLGLFRAWSRWRPAAEVLVYPRPEQPAPPLPAARAVGSGAATARSHGGSELEGIRAYQRGDPLKLIVWKKAARALETGGELVSRDTSSSTRQELWLDWSTTGALAVEERLSRLAAWVLASERAGVAWGLRLPGHELAPGQGEAQRRTGLEALALWA
jgi:uncharacterized protein (DUF58 family)